MQPVESTYYDAPAGEYFGPDAVVDGPLWWPFAAWVAGMVVYRLWDIQKWVRDGRREGKDVGFFDYFSHYTLLAYVSLGLSCSLFFAWRQGVGFSLFGLEIEIPYVPHLSWFMGFWSDTFAMHVMKVFRNLRNRLQGKPL